MGSGDQRSGPLYYRLNVFPIQVPPLRDRKEDIPLLTRHFLQQAASRLRLSCPALTEGNLRALRSYHWPGNVRELQNATERALILAQNGVLHFDLPAGILRNPGFVQNTEEDASTPVTVLTEAELRLLECQNLVAALEKSRWKIHGSNGAAELLGIKPTTLISRIRKLGLKKSHENLQTLRASAA